MAPDRAGRYPRRKAQARHAADPPNLRGTALARSNPRLSFDVKRLDEFDTTADREKKK